LVVDQLIAGNNFIYSQWIFDRRLLFAGQSSQQSKKKHVPHCLALSRFTASNIFLSPDALA